MVLTACGWCLFVQGSMIPSQAESSPHPSTPMEPCMEPCASFQSSDSGASFNSAKGKGESDRAQSSPSKPKKKFIKSSTATRDLERESVKHKKGIGGRLIKLLAKCLESTCVDLLSGVVVLTDMVLTCVDIDLRASGATAPTWAFLTCQGCLCFYVWEATADFALKGKQVFRSLDWLLDFGIITASLTEVVFLILGSAVEEVRILKLLRICRVMRLIRFIRKAPSLRELRKLMMMFASVIRTLAWSFLFCFIAMTLWSMVAVELLHPIVQELSAEGVWSDCEGCKESFATIMQSNLTFLKTMLAGDSWGEVAVPVMRKQPLTIIVFAGALVFIVYGILNLIVAVIVDAAVEQREKDITTLAADLDYELEEDLKLLGRVFKQVDLNEDGELSLDELVTGAESVPEFASRLRVMDIDAAELEQSSHNVLFCKGSAFNIISDIIAEAQAAIEEDGIPWEQVGPFFLGVVLLANVAQFVYPLMEEAMEEDDYDRLPMPSDLPSGQRRAPRIVQEEVDLKLPPKPMSQIVAEDAAKKVAKKPDQAIETHCLLVCGDCWELGRRLRQECQFQLQILNEPETTRIWCNDTLNDFVALRCTPACLVDSWKFALQADACMHKCGNYNTCQCRGYRGSTLDPTCHGFTFSDGSVNPRPDLYYDCALTPPDCKHTSYGVECNTYRYCPANKCLIDAHALTMEVERRIDPEDGKARTFDELLQHYKSVRISFFLQSRQRDAVLLSVPTDPFLTSLQQSGQDFKLRPDHEPPTEPASQVNLGPVKLSEDPFLAAGFTGQARNATKYPNGAQQFQPEASNNAAVAELCLHMLLFDAGPESAGMDFPRVNYWAALWQQKSHEAIASTDVSPYQRIMLGFFRFQGGVLAIAYLLICVVVGSSYILTVTMTHTLAPGHRTCNDQDATTYNDTCIEGVCMGILDSGYQYQTMGGGECVDRQNRRMARYTGDVQEQAECEQICTGDPQCAGYAYSFPLCSIYGTVRTHLPMERPTWSFQAGTDPVAVVIEAALDMSPVQRRSICRKKGVVGDTITFDSDIQVSADEFFSPVRIGIFFLIIFGCFFALPLTDYISRLLKCRRVQQLPKDKDMLLDSQGTCGFRLQERPT
ncbi:unnamed protein product [Durusdinium trenchii]|uniref:EF-hand domain-containing protein n=1 Tax=Durusdinium trenchii TaxID=1381693 RepID=A0ABP0KC10_9DINO